MSDDIGIFEPVEAVEEIQPEPISPSGEDEPELEGEQPEGEEAPEGEETQEQRDGRNTPDGIRKAIKSLRETHPAEAKLINDAYGRSEAYKQVFPTVKDAQTAHAALQSLQELGGVEGIQGQLSDIAEIDSMLEAGDPAVLDKIAHVAGEGLNKLAPEILNRLEKSSPEQYNAAVKPHLVKALASSGLQNAIVSLFENLQTAKTPGATEEFRKTFEGKADKTMADIANWLQNLGKVDPAQSTTKAPDAAMTAREHAIAHREDKAFNQDVQSNINGPMNKAMEKELAPYLAKQLKGLGHEAKADLVQGIYDEVGRLAKADKVYQDQIKAAMTGKRRDAAKAAQLMSAKFDKLASEATKNVVNKRYGKAKSAPTSKGTPVATKQTPGAPIKVAAKPESSQFDWKKTTQDMIFKGQAYLTSGKLVAWR